MTSEKWIVLALYFTMTVAIGAISGKIEGGWDTSPNVQYHIQTDEGPERFFKYQTISGQYRKEKRLEDGTVVGSYGWVDADGYLRLNDYIADDKGYRIVRAKKTFVGKSEEAKAKTSSTNYLTAESNGVASVSSSRDNSKILVFPTASTTFVAKRRPTPPAGYYPIVVANPTIAPKRIQEDAVAITPVPIYTRKQTEIAPAAPVSSYIIPSFPSQRYDALNSRSYPRPQPFDGIHGFRYFLPRQYHEEETDAGEGRRGSYGYVDPFGIRRVVYYKATPEGFQHYRRNGYVGLRGAPYDTDDSNGRHE